MAPTATGQSFSAREKARLRAFVAARRHSRRVRVLRVVLPIAGVLVLGGLGVKANLSFPAAADLSAAGLSVTHTSIIMDSPHLTGFTGNSREYSLTADRAIQPFASPDQVRLESLKATLSSTQRAATTISAESGDYDHVKNTLRLFGSIDIVSGDGYRIKMNDADVNFQARTMVSDNPVKILYENSEITGDRMSTSDGGSMIVVEGGVRTVVKPSEGTNAPAATDN